MPCNSDHMEPTVRERQRRTAAQLLVYVYGALSQPVPSTLSSSAASIYGGGEIGDRYMKDLCAIIGNMTEEQLSRIVYDGRNPQARKLADWWDEHKAEDEKREKAERAALRTIDGAKAFFEEGEKHKRADEAALREYAQITGFYYDVDDACHVFELTDGVVIFTGMDGFAFWKGEKL